ncbi:MAG TPA: 5-(carboxyamino)imidazole ribonucleotide synthase, partial [Nitrospiraceae bacterium]|nr:5-(carboxyamino)imidazole ribonucleotide synthase [Nitrospiraceae bacterium]
MQDVLAPGATLGVLGGGQLGAMFAQAARRLGYRVAVWDSDSDAPALKIADRTFTSLFTDERSLSEFARCVGAVTYEWENIPVQAASAIERAIPMRPSSRILGLLQNRLEQKTFLADRGFPVAPFRTVSDPDELLATAQAVGFPSICKIATAGYDGKGQWRLTDPRGVPAVREVLHQSRQAHSRWIVEQFLPFEKELSVLVVWGTDGDCRLYPVVENLHEQAILRATRVPASIDPERTEQALHLAASVVRALEGVGVFCVEMFLMPDGGLLINEIAPRPHNSGHYTLDACSVSQFEQQVRAVCGLPLGEVRLLTPAAMVNLLGDDLTCAT